MLKAAIAALAVSAFAGIISVQPSLAASEIVTASPAASENSPWYDTNSNAAQSRANLKEKVLTPSTATKIRYLRSVFSPPANPQAPCPQSDIAAPVLVGGDLYVITGGYVSKYNAATGSLIWQSPPDLTFDTAYESLAVSGDLVIVAGNNCESVSTPLGYVYALNTSTGALVWSSTPTNAVLAQAVVATSYVVAAGKDVLGLTFSVQNVSNGKLVWEGASGCSPASVLPMVVGLLVMTYGCDSQGNSALEAYQLATGALVWSQTGNWNLQRGDLSGSAGQHLYATNPSGAVVDLNPLTGQVVYTLTNQAVNVLAVDASRVYATCGSPALSVCAYNITTGTLAWQAPYGSGGIAAGAGGVLYLDSGTALNAATGEALTSTWTYSPTTALAVGDGRLAVISDPRVLDLYGLPGY